MSRLHSQKRRLRAQQRGDGLIDADSDTIDRDAFQEIGSTHEGVRHALELVERTGASDDAEVPTTLQSQEARLPAPAAAAPSSTPASMPATLPSSAADSRYTTQESARLRTMVDGFLQSLSPAELDEVRARLERRKAPDSGTGSGTGDDPAQNPPTS